MGGYDGCRGIFLGILGEFLGLGLEYANEPRIEFLYVLVHEDFFLVDRRETPAAGDGSGSGLILSQMVAKLNRFGKKTFVFLQFL